MEWIAILGPIINGLLAKLFAKCEQKQTASETPQQFLARNYAEGEFTASIVQAATKQVLKADKRARKKLSAKERRSVSKLSRDEAASIASDKLHEAMLATPDEVKAAMVLGAMLPDED